MGSRTNGRRNCATALLGAALLSLVACSSSSLSSAAGGASFCSLLAGFKTSNADLDATLGANDAPGTKAALEKFGRGLTTLQSKAPQVLKPELTAMNEFIASLQGLLATYDFDLVKLGADPAAAEAFGALKSDQFKSSLQTVDDYEAANCAPVGSSVPVSTITST